MTGTLRRECLDHVIVWNERGLRRYLRQYPTYYDLFRPHVSLDKDAPVIDSSRLPPPDRSSKSRTSPALQHHHEDRAA